MWREMIIFAYKQAHNQSSKQSLNSKTEAHSLSLSVDSRGAGQFILNLQRSIVIEKNFQLFHTEKLVTFRTKGLRDHSNIT